MEMKQTVELKQKPEQKPEKLCPLIGNFRQQKDDVDVAEFDNCPCLKNRCAWYYYGHCAVWHIGVGMIKVFMEKQKKQEEKKQEEIK